MTLILLCASLIGETKLKPVAMVMRVEGGAQLLRGTAAAVPLRDMDLLLPGDRLNAGKGGTTLMVFAPGHVERLRGSKVVTVGNDGCTPAADVERLKRALTPVNVKRITKLAHLAHSSRAGVGVLRGSEDPDPPRVTPLHGSTVLTRRPTFPWPAEPGAIGYEVSLITGEGADRRVEWTAGTDRPSLAYPSKKADLPQGEMRYWEVTARYGGNKEKTIIKSVFGVAAKSEQTHLASLRPLAEGEDPGGWVLAAVTYESYGVYGEALALYEKLAKNRPHQANLQRALASYYERGGHKEKAAAARKRAAELRSR